jgi:hypothetical protein
MPSNIRERYAVYDLIDRHIRFKLPARLGGKTIEGECNSVYRNVMERRIDIHIGSRVYEFREPFAVERHESGDIMFIYGDDAPITDTEFFTQHSEASFHGHGAEEAFAALERNSFKIRFKLLETPPKMRKSK